MLFRFFPLRFEFIAEQPLFFPSGKAANTLRGALGVGFRRAACAPSCSGVESCEMRGRCAYARVFAPHASGIGPSGLADWPRPFVFRARHLDGRTVRAGESFGFDLHVFSIDRTILGGFVYTFAAIAREGLGPGRGKAELQRVTCGGQLLFNGADSEISPDVEPMLLDLALCARKARHIQVEFLTPTELKQGSLPALRPEFPVLFGRIRDRIGNLSQLYGAGPLAVDYAETNLRAARIRMTACRIEHHEVLRHSTRTQRSHSIGGFVGTAEYEGDLTEFLPWLEAAQWTGVGRQCVWGKGEIKVVLIN